MPIYPASPVYQRTPRLLFDFFDAGHTLLDSSGNATCAFYQMCDHIPGTTAANDRVIFYPYSDGNPQTTGSGDPSGQFGSLLIYNPNGDFEAAGSYTAPDLKTLLTPGVSSGQSYAGGFGGGFTDGNGSSGFAYLPCARGWDPTANGGLGAEFANKITVAIDLSKIASDPLNTGGLTYAKFLVSTISGAANNPPPHTGSFMGCYDAAHGDIYYCPTQDSTSGAPHGVALKCHVGFSSQLTNFQNLANWEWVNIAAFATEAGFGGGKTTGQGFQSAIAGPDGKIYFIPFGLGDSLLCVFDPAGPATAVNRNDTTGFGNSKMQAFGNWSFFDTSTIGGTTQPGGPRAFTGANVIANRYILMVPWKDNSLTSSTGKFDDWQGNLLYAAVLLDTQVTLGAGACTVFDLIKVSGGIGQVTTSGGASPAGWQKVAAGYEFAFIDRAGIVHFIPTGIYAFGSHLALPVVSWTPDLSNIAGGSVLSSFTNLAHWVATQDPNTNYADLDATSTAWIPPACGGAYDPVRDWAYLASVAPSGRYAVDHTTPWLSRGIITRIRFVR